VTRASSETRTHALTRNSEKKRPGISQMKDRVRLNRKRTPESGNVTLNHAKKKKKLRKQFSKELKIAKMNADKDELTGGKGRGKKRELQGAAQPSR